MDEAPGPPLSQIDNGALRGSVLASKNQKKLFWMSVKSRMRASAQRFLRVDRVILSLAGAIVQKTWWQMDISRIGLDTRRSLAYLRLFRGNHGQLGSTACFSGGAYFFVRDCDVLMKFGFQHGYAYRLRR